MVNNYYSLFNIPIGILFLYLQYNSLQMKENTADFIIETIAPIFNKQGYVGTSLSDLTKATNLTKGAIYCNFKNKEELAIKSFRLNLKNAMTPLSAIISKQTNSIDKLYAVTKYYRTFYKISKSRGGCPILNVGVDAKHNNNILFDEAKKGANKLISNLSFIIQEGIENNEIKKGVDSKSHAANIYTMIEGGVFMSFLQDNKKSLDMILDHIDESIIDKIKS